MRTKLTRIHINQHNIKHNNKNQDNIKPVITAKDYRENRKGNDVLIVDKDGNMLARVIYSPDKPLDCGAKCWIETVNEVVVI